MKIEKITIENFKSIEKLEFAVKKYGGSYTTMFVGMNESGKSNILEAMSFLHVPGKQCDFSDYGNQKKETEEYANIYFHLALPNKNTYIKPIQDKIETGKEFLDFEIENVTKNVFLSREEKQFECEYDFGVKIPGNLFIKYLSNNYYEIAKEQDENAPYEELTEDVFRKYFADNILEIIEKYEPKATLWKPSSDYLISEKVDLNEFIQDIDSMPAIRNIFFLADYDTYRKIQKAIENISTPSHRSKLTSKLNDGLNNYLQGVWAHDIDIVIEITETAQFSLFIKDRGEENKHDRFLISHRSEGAKYFLSFILSLSIENKKEKRENQLILIDEPEAHLHPSAVRELSKELLEIGKKNFVFISTHSPFLIDKRHKQRNIIIKKNVNAATEKREIQEHENFIDDEVLREAFGIEVYRDLLNPHSILVEGCSDKLILQKALHIKGKNYGITNGHGSNIDTIASKLSHDDISILVIVDDDGSGKSYKNKIITIGGKYSEENVFTIRDLFGDIKNYATIEDTLGKEFIESQLKKFLGESDDKCEDFSLRKEAPFITQILNNFKNLNEVAFKKQISEKFEPPKDQFKFKEKFPLLDGLVDKIIEKLENET